MSSEQIVLFDLPSKPPCTAWSLNPWKTRMLLNYKGLDYRTEWVEYPDIKPRLEGHVPPGKPPVEYTIPTIILPSGEYLTDSRAIAARIEADYPSPPIHLDSPILPRLEGMIHRLMVATCAILMPRVPRVLLNEASVPYWVTTREEWLGPLDVLEREKSPQAWVDTEPIVQEVTGLLKEGGKGEGPFFLGKEVSYADFVWAGYLIFARRLGEDVFEGLLERSGDGEAHKALLEGLKEWTARADH